MRLLYLALTSLAFRAVYALPLDQRGLNDVFEPMGPLEETHAGHTAEHTHTPTALPHPAQATVSSRINELLSSLQKPTQTNSKGATESPSQTTANAFPTHSIIGSVAPAPVPTVSWSPKPLPPATSTVDSTPTLSSASSQQPASSGNKEWKVIGVAVIAFSTVAAILLLSVFFDHWWGFIRDLVLPKKKRDGSEELIPDWKKASWHITMDSDPHRYPSLLPPARTKNAEQDPEKAIPQQGMAGVGSGFGKNSYDSYPGHGTWPSGLGILTPLPPAHHPAQQPVPQPAHDPALQRSKSRQQASPAFTDIYGGIE